MPPKGYNGINPFNVKPVILIAKMGTRVYIDYPATITYDIQSNDDILSVCIAVDKARHDIRYSNLNWSRVYYTIGKFMYQEKLIENNQDFL